MKCFKIFCLATLISLLWHTAVTLVFKLGTDFSQNTIFEVFVISIIVLTILEKRKQKSKNFSASSTSLVEKEHRGKSNNIVKQEHIVPSENTLQDDTLPEIPSHLKSFLKNDGYFTLWEGSPKSIYCRVDGEQKGQEHSFYRWAISPKGYEKLFCRNQDGLEYLLDVWDINTKISYKSKRYDLLDEIMENIIGVSKFSRIDEIRQDYIKYAEKLQEYLNKPQQLYSFSPIPLTFSIFGDYFDHSLPANNMRFSMICSGLYGYKGQNNDEEWITELIGNNTETGEKVQIRLNAIRTMITLEDGRKYRKDAFIELIKNSKL